MKEVLENSRASERAREREREREREKRDGSSFLLLFSSVLKSETDFSFVLFFLLLQSERAYLKQSHIGTAQLKGIFKKKSPGKDGYRYYKNVGLGFKTPREAIEGTYIDKKCPFTSDVSIRGRILQGVVKSTKMTRTIIVRRDYMHFIKKYQRFEKRHKNVSAHLSPAFRCKEGDTVIIGQCRPLSKTVRFNVLKVIPAGAKQVKGFAAY